MKLYSGDDIFPPPATPQLPPTLWFPAGPPVTPPSRALPRSLPWPGSCLERQNCF
jgi:hypothetical protein